MAEWISSENICSCQLAQTHVSCTETIRKCKCAQSLDTAGVLGLSLGKQPGAGGANWIQLFCDRHGVMLNSVDNQTKQTDMNVRKKFSGWESE